MKNTMKHLLLSLSFLLLNACASVDYSQPAVFPEAKADQALIYFYRTPGFIGSTYRFNVSEGNNVVGAMAQNSYFYLFTNAGKHTFTVNAGYKEQGSAITMNVQAGKVYYVKVGVQYQVMGGKPIFTQVAEAEAMKLLKSRKYVLPAKLNSASYNVHVEQ